MKISDAIKQLDALIGRHGDGDMYVQVQGRVEHVQMIDVDIFDDQPVFIALGDGTEV